MGLPVGNGNASSPAARPDSARHLAGRRPGSEGLFPLPQKLFVRVELLNWELGSQRQAVYSRRRTVGQAGMLFCLFLSETNVLFKRQCVCAHTPESA